MLPQPVEYVLERLENAGFAAFAVGGCVRDTLLGRVPGDWDVTTAARPEQVLALFDGCAIPTGLKHGTVTVRAEGMGIEVTTFRADGTYTDHRRPDAVTFSRRLEDDLSRRDLTVNAMAMDRRGQITDLFGGREDMKAGVLRCVGDPERRFREDALRILRTLRFAAVLGFAIEPRTAAALHETAPLLKYIAPERILSEMDRALCGGHILPVLLDYPDVLAVFLPEIAPCVGFDQCNRHHIYDVWGHSAHAAAAIAPEPVLRWAALLHDVGKPPCFSLGPDGVGHFYGHAAKSTELAESILTRLRFDTAGRTRIMQLIRYHDLPIAPEAKPIRRLINKLGVETVRQLFELHIADTCGQSAICAGRVETYRQAERVLDELLAADACFSLKDLAVNGDDLLTLGLRGRAVGAALQACLDAVMDETLPNDRAALLGYAAENLQRFANS